MGTTINNFKLLLSSVLVTSFISTATVKAQLTPDNTLGNENSIVTPTQLRDLIEGGAIRDANLFHSFLEFNVDAGREVYFANPDGIANILTRVTGSNPSNILGVLGVDGAANLFLLNPNGIVFGEGASLDVNGSFLATTAEGISFGEQGVFSAINPEIPGLLTIQPGALFVNQLPNQSGTIVNRGSLVVEESLTLTAGNLDLQGQLLAGENLTLEALDTVTIRDSINNPFIAAAGEDVLIQGNQAVDIFALNSVDSGLFAGGNLVLRSGNPVGGDAHYWSGGSFQVEDLEGNLGDLFSPKDPVIRALGDVSFDTYGGASLHIIAGGSVNVSNIFISTTEMGTESSDFIQENITLSDGTEIFIDGSAQPTVDIRAGVNPNQIGVRGITGQGFLDIFFDLETFIDDPPVFTNNPTGADINIGNVVINPPNGVILLTNQYEPNSSLARGNIAVNGNFQRSISATGQEGDTTSVYLNSQGDIIIANSVEINSSSNTGAGGDITLIAEGNILLNDLSTLSTSSEVGNGGNIKLIAEDVLLNFFTFVDASNGGDIRIQSNRLLIDNFSFIVSSPTVSSSQLTAGGGDISIQATESITIDGGNIGTLGSPDISTNSGDIFIETGELTVIGAALDVGDLNSAGFITGGDITSDINGAGDAGNIDINARQVKILNGGQIRASVTSLNDTIASGNAGNITISASDFVEVSGISEVDGTNSKIATQVNPGSTGDGGYLLIETNRLIVSNQAQIQAGTFGEGQGGNLTVNATESIEIIDFEDNTTGLFTGPERSTATGNGGDITITTSLLNIQGIGATISNRVGGEATGNAGNTLIEADQINIANGGQITTGSFGVGNGGKLTINTSESINLFGTDTQLEDEESSGIFTGTFGFGNAGELIITTGSLSIQEGATITASNFGFSGDISPGGQSGNITIEASESINIRGISSSGTSSSILSDVGALFGVPNSSSTAQGGNLNIITEQLILTDGADISTQTFGESNAGNITIESEKVVINDAGSVITTSTNSTGNAGDLHITAFESLNIVGSGGINGENGIFSQSLPDSSGNAGNITIQTQRLNLSNAGQIGVNSIGEDSGNAGTITVFASDSLTIQGFLSEIASGTFSSVGNGGNVIINAGDLTLEDDAFIATSSVSIAEAGDIFINTTESIKLINSGIIANTLISEGGDINITAQNILLRGNSDIATNIFFSTTEKGGNINLTADSILAFDDSDILAFAQDGIGGNITLNTPAFFGEDFTLDSLTANPDNNSLNNNNRVDINATGAVSGIVSLPDVSFIQNSLSDLQLGTIPTDAILANSCISRTAQLEGNFNITGRDNLPLSPSSCSSAANFPTGTIRTIPNETSSPRPWEIGNPIVEAQGVYQLPNGKLILSREC